MASWGTFFAGAVGPLARKVLVHLGIGVVSFAAVKTVIVQLSSAVQGAMGGLGNDVYALLAMAGFVDAVSIALAAVTTAVGVAFVSKLGVISK